MDLTWRMDCRRDIWTSWIISVWQKLYIKIKQILLPTQMNLLLKLILMANIKMLMLHFGII